MRRLLSIFLAALGMTACAQTRDPLAPLLAFAARQPQDLALVTAAIRTDGTPDPTRHAVRWNATQPMPLASSVKIVVLAAYARAISAGRLDPDSPVKLSEWQSFFVPGTDGGAHQAALKALKIPTDAQGHVKNPEQTVTLDTVARFMIETSDNAATDVLLTRLGRAAVPETITALHLTGQEPLGPLLGNLGNWVTSDSLTDYARRPLAQRIALDWQKASELSADRAARLNLTRSPHWPSVQAQGQLTLLTDPKGTMNDLSSLMARVISGARLSAPELSVMRRHLSWPLRVNPQNAGAFEELYAKGGSLSGVLTYNMAFRPKVGPRAGEMLVVSVALRNIPVNESAALQNTLDEALLMIAIRPDFAERLVSRLKK